MADAERVAASTIAMISALNSSDPNSTSQDPSSCTILSGLRFDDLWDVVRDCGYELEPLGRDTWMKRIKSVVEKGGEKHTLYPLIHVLEREVAEPVADDAFHTYPTDDAEVEVVKGVIRGNVSYLADVGFLPRAR